MAVYQFRTRHSGPSPFTEGLAAECESIDPLKHTSFWTPAPAGGTVETDGILQQNKYSPAHRLGDMEPVRRKGKPLDGPLPTLRWAVIVLNCPGQYNNF